MTHSVIETRDVDEAATILRDQFQVRIGVHGERHGLRFDQHSLGADVQLTRATYDLQASVFCTGLPQIYLTRLRSGRLSYEIGRQENRWSAGDLFMVADVEAPWTATMDDADCDFLAIDPQLLRDVADVDDGGIAITGYEPVSAEAARTWSQAFDYARQVAGSSEMTPFVQAAVRRLLAAVTLSTFPNTGSPASGPRGGAGGLGRHGDPEPGNSADAHPATVRRAVAYVESHLDQPFTIANVAAACHVSARAVQLAFRRHLDTTPLAYARRARLDQARRNLLAATPRDGQTVTAIASRWGFADQGRFTRQYREAYGESPGQTLRR